MEVRIGVVYTARELNVETDDSVDGDQRGHRVARSSRGDSLLVAHRHEGSHGRRTDRQDRVRRDRCRRGRPQGRLRRELAATRAVIGPAPDLLDRRLLFFTGKGGVGKSTMAAATALLAPSIGKRVLLVEVDAKGDVPAQFEHAPVGFTPKRDLSRRPRDGDGHRGVVAASTCKLNLRVPVLGRIGPLARVLDFVATAAPGVKEILTIGKIAWEVRESIEGRADWDLVDRRRGRDRSHRRPARRRRRDPRARRRRAVAQPDAMGLRASSPIPRSPRSTS